MKKYTLGLDYGTLSVRALCLDLETGQEACTAVYEYPHGIMTDSLPDGTPLPKDFALEHPLDYLEGMEQVVRQVMQALHLRPEQIVGIGLDVTSSTVLPVDEKGQPLCMTEAFYREPHAWMKLWKHHSAADIAQRMTEVARDFKEPWLPYYGNRVNPEFLLAKATELAVKAPQVYENAALIMEAADWLVWLLTGNLVRSLSMAGCTGYYREGFPIEDFFEEAYPQAKGIRFKLAGCMLPLGTTAGFLTQAWANRLGLCRGTPVGIGTLDSHMAVIGCGGSRVGDVVTVMGTSACTMVNAEKEGRIEGIYLAAQDANVPGLYGYEGSQNCVGDMLGWFVDNCVPHKTWLQAQEKKMDIHAWLMAGAKKLTPGQSGVMALDWFNGNRTPLMDLSLTGCITGLTLRTTPEQIYRALMEGAAFGFRRILELFQKGGIRLGRIIAGGGIPGKNPVMMQIYADVCGMPIHLSKTNQASALGSAILGAAAAGEEYTGCKDVPALMEKYAILSDTVYMPNKKNKAIYDELYEKYLKLSDKMENKL